MSYSQFYREPETSWWDESAWGFSSHVERIDLNNRTDFSGPGSRFGLVGFCCDQSLGHGSGSSGAASAPGAIRDALQKIILPTHQAVTFCDVGNIVCLDGSLKDSQRCLADVIASLTKQGVRPIVLGGGTETSWGCYQGLMQVNPCSHLGLVNFSSCMALQSKKDDFLRTAFRQIMDAQKEQNLDVSYACIGAQPTANTLKEFDYAHEMNGRIFPAELLQHGALDDIEASIDEVVKVSETILLSINLNVFAAAYAAGVVRPQTLGLTPWQVIPLIRQLVLSGKVGGIEILGLNPTTDLTGMTAALAAQLIIQFVCSFL